MNASTHVLRTEGVVPSADDAVLSSDEAELLEAYRRAKTMRFADIAVTIQEGKRVKLWLTEKMR